MVYLLLVLTHTMLCVTSAASLNNSVRDPKQVNVFGNVGHICNNENGRGCNGHQGGSTGPANKDPIKASPGQAIHCAPGSKCFIQVQPKQPTNTNLLPTNPSSGSCQVTCKKSSCQVRTGGTMGSCFLPPFKSTCSGLPSGCGSCVNECKNKVQPNQPSRPIRNPSIGGNIKCQTTCESNGSCKVKMINGPTGRLSGSCFPPGFGGSCSGIPRQCQRGSNIAQQCGTPCQAGTRNA